MKRHRYGLDNLDRPPRNYGLSASTPEPFFYEEDDWDSDGDSDEIDGTDDGWGESDDLQMSNDLERLEARARQ